MKRILIMSLLAATLCYTSACNSGEKSANADQNTGEDQAMVSPGQENLAANEAPTTSDPNAGREANVENSDAAMQPGDASKPAGDMTAEQFAKEAASGGMMEVALGELATQKAQAQQVKDFGKQMMADHKKANEKLKSLAAQKKITLPDQMMEKHQQHVTELSKLSGSEFDTHYMSMMVEDHQEDVSKFKQAASSLKDAELKSFASATLPTLQQHLEKAQQINSSLEGGTARTKGN
ncbi:DUF4142 domain-containing protein [Rhodocytophaga aerolata]|uniref:DUF4142 domain-containing protein n=1 Tax=Rhodocytophaga aerolata TaxID=455078 RepID=A0ABT8QZK1_9BACT|nr:DUF4142 domain-containing protein [Rhodocytophaga aerolata]MDO1444836.1 DUF4142 domain-containing protein [Rhodocytophaga aerolata]